LAAAAVAGVAHAGSEKPGGARSRVVLIRRRSVVSDDGAIDELLLHGMLNQGIAELLQVEDSGAAWKRLFGPEDVVGIKSNVWSRLPTPPALETAIRSELEAVGVPAAKISVGDRGVRRDAIMTSATALINVRPMRTHHWSGLGTCLKNVITFVPRPSDYHADACASLGALWRLPEVAGKVRLNLLVMLTPQFHSVGPHSFSKKFVWPYGGLLLGTEPASVDAVGSWIIEAKRREFFGGPKPIAPPPHHIQIADERYGLGATTREGIELVRLGWKDGALI
jgi:hypothetical protein